MSHALIAKNSAVFRKTSRAERLEEATVTLDDFPSSTEIHRTAVSFVRCESRQTRNWSATSLGELRILLPGWYCDTKSRTCSIGAPTLLTTASTVDSKSTHSTGETGSASSTGLNSNRSMMKSCSVEVKIFAPINSESVGIRLSKFASKPG